MKFATGFAFAFLFLANFVQALPARMHPIDSDATTGFALYRSSAPDRDGVKDWCKIGIQEVYVLSGDADDHEFKYRSSCPSLKVVYHEKQNPNVSLSRSFLNNFDDWVKSAKTSGKKILFRCVCGCHRTGRLAAYYRMKYHHWSTAEAIREMNAIGIGMDKYPSLKPQVRALEDYIYSRQCRQSSEYCVKENFFK